jgi:hypothetical protein
LGRFLTSEPRPSHRLKPVELFQRLVGEAFERGGITALGGRGNASRLVDQEMQREAGGVDAEQSAGFGFGKVNRQARPGRRHDRSGRLGPCPIGIDRDRGHREARALLQPHPLAVQFGQVRACVPGRTRPEADPCDLPAKPQKEQRLRGFRIEQAKRRKRRAHARSFRGRSRAESHPDRRGDRDRRDERHDRANGVETAAGRRFVRGRRALGSGRKIGHRRSVDERLRDEDCRGVSGSELFPELTEVSQPGLEVIGKS